jgi:hypothetical protein
MEQMTLQYLRKRGYSVEFSRCFSLVMTLFACLQFPHFSRRKDPIDRDTINCLCAVGTTVCDAAA